jgi:hypothetical protein
MWWATFLVTGIDDFVAERQPRWARRGSPTIGPMMLARSRWIGDPGACCGTQAGHDSVRRDSGATPECQAMRSPGARLLLLKQRRRICERHFT